MNISQIMTNNTETNFENFCVDLHKLNLISVSGNFIFFLLYNIID